jgi:hypothetical protein
VTWWELAVWYIYDHPGIPPNLIRRRSFQASENGAYDAYQAARTSWGEMKVLWRWTGRRWERYIAHREPDPRTAARR